MAKDICVMIPGTLCDELLFKPQVLGLSEVFQGEVVSNYSADSLSEIADNIASSIKGNFSIMGLSYGGIIAFELLRKYPERIDRLILMNTNHKEPSEKTRASQERFVGMATLGNFNEITTHHLTDILLHPEHSTSKELRQTVFDMAVNVGVSNFIKQIKAQLARPDSTETLRNTKCKTLIITGREDIVCPIAQHQEMQSLVEGSTLEVIEKCGHLSTLEQPEVVNEIIKNWW